MIDAPCGKAAVFTGGQSHVLPPTFSPTGEQIEVLTAEFHAMIPVVSEGGGEQRMCLIAFSTPQITHWERCYAPVMAGVLRSLRFTEGEQNSADTDVAPPTRSVESSGQSVRL
ncbi:hypothetical protein [Streptomyces sp. NPDC091209]|uniref:hypothetical protein n=1 Tax=Streptomyces sp. NPDC091209 TaxID=3365974 RepID=UPI00381BE0BE